MKSTRRVLLACATVATLGYALNASAITKADCRKAFNRSEASNTCKVLWAAEPEKPGRYWQCHMQLRCSTNRGTSATISSGFQYNQLHKLVNCGNGDVAYRGNCR